MNIPATDYALTREETDVLKGVVLMPVDLREELLRRYAAERGTAALVTLFTQMVGLANSVIANNRQMIELRAIQEGTVHPHDAHKLNLPTLFGALGGVALAASAKGCKGMCKTCAYRLGSPANQCEPTVCDADWQADAGAPFLCHHTDGRRPMKACRGHARRVKQEAVRG